MPVKKVYLLMFLATLFWSFNMILAKLVVQHIPTFSLVYFRFIFTLPFIFLILYKYQPANLIPQKSQLLPILFIGVFGIFVYHCLYFYGLIHTTAINSSLILAMNPVLSTFLGEIYFGEKITLQGVIGVFISCVGVFLVVSNCDIEILKTLHFNRGDIITLVAMLFWVLHSLYSAKFMHKYNISPLTLTAYSFLVCTIVSFPFTIWENPISYYQNITVRDWLIVFYMALFSSVLGYSFQQISFKYIGAIRTNIFQNVVPIFTTILAITILKEPISWVKVISAGIIITGAYLTLK